MQDHDEFVMDHETETKTGKSQSAVTESKFKVNHAVGSAENKRNECVERSATSTAENKSRDEKYRKHENKPRCR